MAYFNVNYHFVYIMKIHKYERTFVRFAHKVLPRFACMFQVLITYES